MPMELVWVASLGGSSRDAYTAFASRRELSLLPLQDG